jgi:hypothetical protein
MFRLDSCDKLLFASMHNVGDVEMEYLQIDVDDVVGINKQWEMEKFECENARFLPMLIFTCFPC